MVTAVEEPVETKTKGKILIVDDETVVRDSLGKWFSSEGYQARPVASAREALESITNAEYDVALLDIKMPGMDGMELQARLKEADPELTVIIMTGYASVETAVQALKLGAYDYITKPIDPDELSHLVANAMEHRQARREVVRLRENLQEVSPSTELIGKAPQRRREGRSAGDPSRECAHLVADCLGTDRCSGDQRLGEARRPSEGVPEHLCP